MCINKIIRIYQATIFIYFFLHSHIYNNIMGVPVFFKWLTIRNPKIIRDAVQPIEQSETFSSTGNPSIDNFYIDMNGLIHPSCNPKGENIKIPKNFEQQCSNIYDYIDKLMNIIRPKKTLYLAIDGVAPRAKMNQQRSRRFKAAMQGQESFLKKKELLQKFKAMGAWNQDVENYATQKGFDSNTITPGTQFLNNVCIKLREYIRDRLQNHKFWKNLTVVFSDSNCPGEGQHKIMDFIRQQRASSSYTTGQSHCIYGADADLIMLGLSTHEPKFYIIRQQVITAKDKYCTICNNKGHFFLDCQKANSIEDQSRVARQINAQSINVTFQFIRIQMVRQFIHINFMRSTIPFGYDIERIIDDFIFLCFFVGNDFLPHVPCLSIRQGGIDVLLKVYQYCLSIMPDYITQAGNINLKSLKCFVNQMTYYEDPLINQMIYRQQNSKQREINNRNYQQRGNNKVKMLDETKKKQQEQDELIELIDMSDPVGSFRAVMQKNSNPDGFNLDDYSVFKHSIFNYKEKYYRQKFKISPSQFLELKSNVSKCYLEALKWICEYYYKGVPSWSWFYPFHYSPFFTDLNVPQQNIPNFDQGTPFKPFEQLMAVLPPRTCDALPKFLHYYMKDVQSPIIDYYPSNFHVDLVGKRFAWLGQVILPFIDDKRLLSAIGDYEKYLNQQEKYRNRLGFANVYINKYGLLGRKINKQTEIGKSLNLSWQQGHDLEGELNVLQNDQDFIAFAFEPPMGRVHSTALKQGSNFNPLQEIDDQFISKTDKGAFGGFAYAKLVQNVMSQRRDKLRKKRSTKEEQQYNKQDRHQNRDRDRDRSKQDDRQRSRQKKPYQRNYYDNDQRNRNYNNNQRGGGRYESRNYQNNNYQRNNSQGNNNQMQDERNSNYRKRY